MAKQRTETGSNVMERPADSEGEAVDTAGLTPEQLAEASAIGVSPVVFSRMTPEERAREKGRSEQVKASAERKNTFKQAANGLGGIGEKLLLNKPFKDKLKIETKAATRTAKEKTDGTAVKVTSIPAIVATHYEAIKSAIEQETDKAKDAAIAMLDTLAYGTDPLSKQAKDTLGEEYANATQSSALAKGLGLSIGKALAKEYVQAAASL